MKDSLRSAVQDVDSKNKSLSAQIQTHEEMRKMEQKEAEQLKKKLQQGLNSGAPN